MPSDEHEIEIDDDAFKMDQLEVDDISMFDVEDDTGYEIKENRYIKPKIFRSIKNVKYRNAGPLARDIATSVFDGERIYSIINGSFVFGDFVEALMDEARDEVIEELTISTLSMSVENVASLKNLMDYKQVKKINLIISDYFFAHYRSLINFMYKELDTDDSFTLAVAGTHTKVTLMRMASGQKIVMHGSANLRSSSSMEQFMIETSDELYDFNYEWHSAVLDKYATINKSIRGEDLWKTIKD